MEFHKVHEVVSAEYSPEIATLVVVALTLNLAKKVKPKHIQRSYLFTSELDEKTRNILWEYEEDTIILVIKIRDCVTSYLDRLVLQGLGGCVVKPLRQLVEES